MALTYFGAICLLWDTALIQLVTLSSTHYITFTYCCYGRILYVQTDICPKRNKKFRSLNCYPLTSAGLEIVNTI